MGTGCLVPLRGKQANTYCREVPNLVAGTLQALVVWWILPETRFISDGWETYGGLGQIGQNYQHDTVIHEQNFVDPVDATLHTNTENLWMRVKRK